MSLPYSRRKSIFDVWIAFGGKADHFSGSTMECIHQIREVADVPLPLLRSWFRYAVLDVAIGQDVPFCIGNLEGSIIVVSGNADDEEFYEPYDPAQQGDTDDEI